MDEYSFISQAQIKADRRPRKPESKNSYWLERQGANWLRRRQDESGHQLSLFASEGSHMRKALTVVGLSLSINFALLGLFAVAFGNFAGTRHGEVTVSEVESTYAYAPVASASPSAHQF